MPEQHVEVLAVCEDEVSIPCVHDPKNGREMVCVALGSLGNGEVAFRNIKIRVIEKQ